MSTPQERLGQKLRALREFAGLSTRELAQAVRDTKGLSQSMITRIESGRLPTRPQIQAWAKATRADRETREQLIEEAEAIHTQVRAWRNVINDESRHEQDEVAAREKAATSVRNYQPAFIPGLLQTRAYAERIFPILDFDDRMDYPAAVKGRMDRQQALLEPGRDFHFIIGEGAFRWNPGLPMERFVEQVAHVAALAALDTVTVAVLPIARVDEVLAMSNFIIYDGEQVRVAAEVPHAQMLTTEPGDVALYGVLYGRLWDASVKGQSAIDLIRDLADSQRGEK